MNAQATQKLNTLFDDDQLDQIVDILARVKERAVERDCDQEVCIGITRNGHPRYINATDNVKLRKPSTYRAE
jgi:hypothetical protein